MKKNTTTLTLSLVTTFLMFTSCKEKTDTPKEETLIIEEEVIQEDIQPITLKKLENSPAYADAVLKMDTPTKDKVLESGDIDFDFTVDNYELGAQTKSVNAEQLANSDKGQHIHFILDNQPYSAHYEPAFAKEIPNGSHLLVAFLSRSYHESVKSPNAVVVRKLDVGTTAKDSSDVDAESPTLIYSRPKGTYTGKDTEQILLDFFVLNTTLSEDGNKVRATINDEEFLITEWVPHVIEGLPMGEITVTLELIDGENNPIPGPYNKVTRKVTLKP